MHYSTRIEFRSKPPEDALPGEETPAPYDANVPPGMAAAVWQRSGGVCERGYCRHQAERVIVVPHCPPHLEVYQAWCLRCLGEG